MDLEKIIIDDILKEPTKIRPEFQDNPPETSEDFSGFSPEDDFETPIEWDGTSFPSGEEEEEEPYDPETESENLVNMVTAGNAILMTPIANFRLIKAFGGRKKIQEMKKAFVKKNSGKELSEKEQQLAESYANYSAQLNMISGDLMYTPEQIQMLKTAALPMCKRRKLKVSADWAFWSVLLGIQTDKLFKAFMR